MSVTVCLALAAAVHAVAAPPVAFQKAGALYPRVRFSPCGKYLVMTENTYRLTVWEVKTGKELWEDPDVIAVWFEPKDGEAIVKSNKKGRYRRADLATGEEVGEFIPQSPTRYAGFDQPFDPIAGRMAWLHYPNPPKFVEGDGGRLQGRLVFEGPIHLIVTNTGNGDVVSETVLSASETPMRVAALAPGGKHVAVEGRWGDEITFRVFDAATGKKAWEVGSGQWAGYKVHEFAPDGKRLALYEAGETGRKLTVRATTTGKVAHTLAEEFFDLFAARWSPDGKRIGALIRPLNDPGKHVGLKPVGLTVWDAASGEKLFTVPDAWRPNDLAFSPDRSTVAVATHSGAVILLDARTGKPFLGRRGGV